MENYLISVLIPVYNVAPFVEEAVLSICNQSYKNLEIIVIDDCSTDQTYQIVERLAQIDSRIIALRNEQNVKIVKTLNRGLNIARGQYIARMDGDDICSPERLAKQLQFLLDHPQYSLVGSHVYTIDANGTQIGQQTMPTEQQMIAKSLLFSSPVLHIWLAKAEVYQALDGYREIPGAEDYDFLLRMYSTGLYFTNLDSFEYSVRIRDGNTTSTIGFQQRLMSNYVVDLYHMRKKNQVDNFSVENVQDFIARHAKFKTSFDQSNEYLAIAHRAKAKQQYFSMFLYLVKSVLGSRFQRQYLMKRLRFKLVARK